MFWLASCAAPPPRGAPTTVLAAPKWGEHCPTASADYQWQQREPGWPHGILYNHISTTGGTTMKGLLRDVMGTKGGSKLGDDRSGWNVTFIDVEHHVEGNDTDLVGKDGALVVEEDVRHDLHVRRAASRPTHTPTPPPPLGIPQPHGTSSTPRTCTHMTPQVTARDAANFFVIGVVRRPCDYMVSRWAKSSESKRARNATRAAAEGYWGETSPYDSSDGAPGARACPCRQ